MALIPFKRVVKAVLVYLPFTGVSPSRLLTHMPQFRVLEPAPGTSTIIVFHPPEHALILVVLAKKSINDAGVVVLGDA